MQRLTCELTNRDNMPKKGKVGGRGKKRKPAVKSESEEDDSVCAFCNERYHVTEEFEIHISLSHDHPCQYCDLFFITEDQLAKHVANLHPEVSQRAGRHSDHLKEVLSEEDVRGAGRASEEKERVEETEACLDVGEEQFENFSVESPVEQRVSEEEKDDEEDSAETLNSDESVDGIETDSPEEGLGHSSEGSEGGESDQSGDDTNEDLENETPEAELATTICAQCAPAVQRLLANVERRVLQQLQEIPDG